MTRSLRHRRSRVEERDGLEPGDGTVHIIYTLNCECRKRSPVTLFAVSIKSREWAKDGSLCGTGPKTPLSNPPPTHSLKDQQAAFGCERDFSGFRLASLLVPSFALL